MPEKKQRSRIQESVISAMLLPFQSGIKPTWTRRQIRSALTQHQMGMLGQSSLLFDSMLEDDEFPFALKERCDALLQAPFCLQPVEKDPPKPKSKKAEDGADEPGMAPGAAGQPAAPLKPTPAAPEPPPHIEKTVTRKSDGTRSETVKEKPGVAPEPALGPAGPPEPVEPIEPVSKLKPHQRRAAELWPIMVPYGEALRLDADVLVMGVGLATIDWDTRSAAQGGQPDGLWVPTLRALPTEFLRYDHAERCWMYQCQQATAKWDSTKGKLPGVLGANDGAGEVRVVPGDGKWVLLEQGQRGWLWGMIRGLAPLWNGKQETYCNWQRYNQKHGLPIVKAILPITGEADEKEDFVDDLGSVVREGVIGLPQDEEGYGYNVELLEPTTVTWQSFQAGLERDDRKIQIALLGGNLGSEVAKSGGNMGAAATHSSKLPKLAGGDGKVLGLALREQFLRPFFELNFGPEKTKDLPTPHWEADPEEDVRAWTTAQGQFAVTVKTLGEAGYEVMNLGDVAEDFGMQLGKKPESAMAPAAGPPGAAPPVKPGAPTAPPTSTAK